MGPAQVAALEKCGIKIEEYGEGIVFRDFESFDIISSITFFDPSEDPSSIKIISQSLLPETASQISK